MWHFEFEVELQMKFCQTYTFFFFSFFFGGEGAIVVYRAELGSRNSAANGHQRGTMPNIAHDNPTEFMHV